MAATTRALVGTSGGGGYGGNAGGVGRVCHCWLQNHDDRGLFGCVTLHSIGGAAARGRFHRRARRRLPAMRHGGDGNTATINNAGGQIDTSGDHSYGILVQSIGGSGRHRRIATADARAGWRWRRRGKAETASVQNTGIITRPAIPRTASSRSRQRRRRRCRHGGRGAVYRRYRRRPTTAGTARSAARVAISTAGDAAIGIMAQSRRGGGGSGGGAEGIAGRRRLGRRRRLRHPCQHCCPAVRSPRQEEMAHAIMAQSIGAAAAMAAM